MKQSRLSSANINKSIFQAKADGNLMSPESPSPSSKPRRSLTSKIRDTTESLRSRSKSRERVTGEKASTLKKDSKNKNVFTSTLSLFKKRERKKSIDDGTSTPETDAPDRSLESIGNVEFTFDSDRASRSNEDSIFISLHADSRNYEEALPSESVSIPLETPTKLLDEYDNEPRSGSIVTEVSIEHQASISRIRTEAKIENSSPTGRESLSPIRPSASKDSQMTKSSSRDSKISVQTTMLAEHGPEAAKSTADARSSTDGSARDTTVANKPAEQMVKPKRRSKEVQQQIHHIPVEQTDAAEREARRRSDASVSEGSGSLRQSASRSEKHSDEGLMKPPQETLVKTPSIVSDLDHNSSESERDSEIDFIRNKAEKAVEELPDERKGLCYEESFEEDLPYVPTTLPMEKSVAMPILPVKQRLQEVR